MLALKSLFPLGGRHKVASVRNFASKLLPKKWLRPLLEKGISSYKTLIKYQYEIAIGDQPITPQEWQQLVNAKTPLIKFRGQWMELDQSKMQQMLYFWQKQQAENTEMTSARVAAKNIRV